MRSLNPPYNTWQTFGYHPFEVFGERFAITAIPASEPTDGHFRATHIATGAAVPNTECDELRDVYAKACKVLESVGPGVLRKSLDKVAELLANNAVRPS